jgi:FkbM family methyltransferase
MITKKNISNLLKFIGLLPYIHIFKERYFPSSYFLNSLKEDVRYLTFYGSFINEYDLCFDIGAHRGHRTNIFLNLGARVVAFEPQAHLSKYLQLKFGKKIFLENIGLGSSVQEMMMYISDISSLSTFSVDWLSKAEDRFPQVKWHKKKKIKVTTLDKMIEKYGVPNFCKIDVEGFEYEVIQGLTQPIKCISIEFMTPENNEVIKNCLIHLQGINPRILVNYSIGDTAQLCLDEWLNFTDAMAYFNQHLFNQSNWGDIYIKMDL